MKQIIKPSNKAKRCGLESLNEMSELTCKSVSSLILLNKNHPKEFDLLVLAAVIKKVSNILFSDNQ